MSLPLTGLDPALRPPTVNAIIPDLIPGYTNILPNLIPGNTNILPHLSTSPPLPIPGLSFTNINTLEPSHLPPQSPGLNTSSADSASQDLQISWVQLQSEQRLRRGKLLLVPQRVGDMLLV